MVIFQISFMPIANANSPSLWDKIFDEGNDFIKDGKQQASLDKEVDEDKLQESINMIYNVLLGLGIALSVIIGAMLGIKYMIGSIEEQAKIKETLIGYIVGCIVVFGAFGIWKLVIEILGKTIPT